MAEQNSPEIKSADDFLPPDQEAKRIEESVAKKATAAQGDQAPKPAAPLTEYQQKSEFLPPDQEAARIEASVKTNQAQPEQEDWQRASSLTQGHPKDQPLNQLQKDVVGGLRGEQFTKWMQANPQIDHTQFLGSLDDATLSDVYDAAPKTQFSDDQLERIYKNKRTAPTKESTDGVIKTAGKALVNLGLMGVHGYGRAVEDLGKMMLDPDLEEAGKAAQNLSTLVPFDNEGKTAEQRKKEFNTQTNVPDITDPYAKVEQGSEQTRQDVMTTLDEIAGTPLKAWDFGTYHKGGFGFIDNFLLKHGWMSEDQHKQNWMNQSAIRTAQANQEELSPSNFARYASGIVKMFGPSAAELQALNPNLSDQDALNEQQAMAMDTIKEAAPTWIKPALEKGDEGIRTAAGLVYAPANEFAVAMRGAEMAMGIPKASGYLYQLQKAYREIPANAGPEYTGFLGGVLTRAERMNAAKSLATSRINEIAQDAERVIPKAVSASAAGALKLTELAEKVKPLALATGIGGIAGYERGREHGEGVLGALTGALAGAALEKGGALTLKGGLNVIKDVADAQKILNGGLGNAYRLAGNADWASKPTKWLFGGDSLGSIIRRDGANWIQESAVPFAMKGVEMGALTAAMDIMNDTPSDKISADVATGIGMYLIPSLTHSVFMQSPESIQRRMQKETATINNAISQMSPESRATLDAMGWDTEVSRRRKLASDADEHLADAQQGLANAKTDAERKKWTDLLQSAQEAVKYGRRNLLRALTANVQTRLEFNRQFKLKVAELNNLFNGSARAGQPNVGIEILTTRQIAEKLLQNSPELSSKYNSGDTRQQQQAVAEAMNAAEQNGFVSDPTGGRRIDATKPVMVVNAENLASSPKGLFRALVHEAGHAGGKIPQFKDAMDAIREVMFKEVVRDKDGKIFKQNNGLYGDDDLVRKYFEDYLGGRSPQEALKQARLQRLTTPDGTQIDKEKVIEYMKEEMMADALASGLVTKMSDGGEGMLDHVRDWAKVKADSSIVARKVLNVLGEGGKDPRSSDYQPISGVEITPEIQKASEEAVDAMKKLDGSFSYDPVGTETAPKMSRTALIKNKGLLERYGKDSGLVKTQMRATIVDKNGNVIHSVDIKNPNAVEGSWSVLNDGTAKQTRGYGQLPDELAGMTLPEGAHVDVSSHILYEPDGETPIFNKPREVKKLLKNRNNAIREAIKNAPDDGTPNRFDAYSEDELSMKGVLQPSQIKAIMALPETIVPFKIKQNILAVDRAIKENLRMWTDYSTHIDPKTGKYTGSTPVIRDNQYIAMHFSKAGNFTGTAVSWDALHRKMRLLHERVPHFFDLWGGNVDEFYKEFTNRYLKNIADGVPNDTGLDPDRSTSIAKRNKFRDFLGFSNNSPMTIYPERTIIPRKKGERKADLENVVRSFRLDAIIDMAESPAKVPPIKYKDVLQNFFPRQAEEQAPIEEERKTSPLDLGITAAHSAQSQPFSAQYVAPQTQAQAAPKSDLFFMPASAEIREKGSKQHLEFWNRELENSGIKEKPTTMGALDAFIHKYVSDKYTLGLSQGISNESKERLYGIKPIFPQVNPEKIKSYYQKVVRGATAEQALNFPENWRRVRNMSDEEFNNFFTEDRVDEITKSRVETLAKSANYLLGEMKAVNQKEIDSLKKQIDDLLDEWNTEEDINRKEKINDEYHDLQEKRKLLQDQQDRGSYTPAEVAAILDASAKVRVRTAQDEDGNLVPVKQKITNGNEVVPNEVSGATASRIAEYMRQGMGSEDAYVQGVFDTMKARAEQRGTYTGWKKYDQSDDMGEAEKLNTDVAGTNWCTGGAVHTAHQHLRGGDFYVYFDEGEPQVAIRTEDGQIAEVRGRGEGQNITTPKYDQAAEDFIRSGEGPQGGNEYLHDREFRKMAVKIMQTGEVPEEALKYYCEAGIFSEVKPKMSYKREFEPEYVEAFKTAVIPQSKIFDRNTGTLNTSLEYVSGEPENSKYKQVKGNIYLSDYIVDNKLELPNLEKCGDIVPKTDHKKLVSVKLPKLEEAGNIDVRRLTTSLQLPKLKKAGEIYAHSASFVELPKLQECKDLIAQSAKALNVPKLKEAKNIDYNSVDGTEYNFNSLEKVQNMWTRGISALEMPKLQEAGLIYNGYLTRGYFPELKKVVHLDSATIIYAPKLEKVEKVNLQHRNELISTEVGIRAGLRYPSSGMLRITDVDTGKQYMFPAGDRGAFLNMLDEKNSQKKEEMEKAFIRKPVLEPWQIRPDEKIVAATYSESSLKGLSPEADNIRTGKTHLEADPTASENRTERETDEYGFLVRDSKGNENVVNRREAFEIAKANDQLKEPETLDQKVDNIRGVLHSDMVNYEVGKAGEDNRKNVGISFMPKEEEEYAHQTGHRPPDEMDGAPMHEVTRGIYPDDFYTLPYKTALRYYAGGGMDKADNESMTAIRSVQGKPDAEITIYRAVPKSIKDAQIYAGDWVTPSRTYAKEHGEAWLKGDYTILSKKVPASHLFTEGNSINEFGYNPPKKSGISFMPSKLDEAHAEAIESGDMKEAQRLVDEAARKAGYTIGPVYHGTNANFNKFTKRVFPNFNNAQSKIGYFFAFNPEYAKQYGDKTIPALLNANLKKVSESLIDEIEGSWTNQKAGKYVADLKKEGYDGIQFGEEEIAVFNPNQIKSADPATYDDEGNLIPLSKRFDTSNPDIRFMPKSEEEKGDSLRLRMTRKALTDAALNQESWKDWYKEHQDTLDDFFGDHAKLFLDILGVTSQAASVKANIGLALKAFGQLMRGEDFTGYLPAVIKNLQAIRDNTDVSGRKISNYKAANKGESGRVVVDRHIARLLYGVDTPSKAQYDKAEQVLTEIAKEIGWEPSQVQAALWAHSIVKSGKQPQSYGSYLKQLESKGGITKRIGELAYAGGEGVGVGGSRGRYSPVGKEETGGGIDWNGLKFAADAFAKTPEKPLAGLETPKAKIPDLAFAPKQKDDNAGVQDISMKPTADGRTIVYQHDPSTSIKPPVKSLKKMIGEIVGMLEADRHNTLGTNMGGPMHPFLLSNQVIARLKDGRGFKPVWANMNAAFVTRAKNIIKNTTSGRALIQLMKEEAHISNRKFVQDVMSELDKKKAKMPKEIVDSLHVILELGARDPAKKLKDVTAAYKAFKKGEINQRQLNKVLKDNKEAIDKYMPMVQFLAKLGSIKSKATRGNIESFNRDYLAHIKSFNKQAWYKAMADKYKNTSFADEAGRFTFNQRGAAMKRLRGIAHAPDIGKMLADSMDFKNGQNLDLVASVQLSKDPEAFAIYTGNDPKQEAKMSEKERYLRDQFMKDPNFRKHPSYDWMMLGPENADNFILDKPVDPLVLFPNYAKNHPKASVRNGSKETIVGTMKKSKIPLKIE
jgi:ADP-Ribosyltransferase in polyvalent proteins